MKYLGIDYGSKRTGVAVSDEKGAVAFARKVFVTTGRLAKEVADYAASEKIEAIVIGESRDYAGAPNRIMAGIISFKKELEGLTRLTVHLEPEYMTSVQAERLQQELGGGGAKRDGNGKDKKNEMLDATAAAFILQSFLDRHLAGKFEDSF